MTAAYRPHAEWAHQDHRAALIEELAALRAYEHRYQDFDSVADRARQIQAELGSAK